MAQVYEVELLRIYESAVPQKRTRSASPNDEDPCRKECITTPIHPPKSSSQLSVQSEPGAAS